MKHVKRRKQPRNGPQITLQALIYCKCTSLNLTLTISSFGNVNVFFVKLNRL
eukprot:TRINITY_DN13646_c0_g1_i1.p3 TRINITY_DN13646_c0_g1~~TRINITY_DN13646_c0_g1_i1.p3  ORF type:complete len:52 (+),score=8.10 TRINITY_DN13646_c0_g1_i1:245-400(+)